jgi:hypothetical protein
VPKPSRARSQVSLKELLTRSATSGSTLPIEAATETTSLLRRATNFSDPALDSISEHLRCLGVGINNDPVLCQLAYPPMSSVDPDGLRIRLQVRLSHCDAVGDSRPKAVMRILKHRGPRLQAARGIACTPSS